MQPQSVTAAKAADRRSVVPDLIRARAEWVQGKPDSAGSRLAGILASGQQNLSAHLLLAMIEENSGNYTEAIVHYRRVVELDPKQAVALNGLAYGLGNHSMQLDEALKLAQQAKELDPAICGIVQCRSIAD
jgi:tetratricopeptide (TPR) repeat protein